MKSQDTPDHLPFVASVLVRPAMYTITGSLAEVFCFLHGFFDGQTQHARDRRVMEQAHRQWYGFLTWLQPRLGQLPSDGWHEIYSALHQQYPSDEEALVYLETAYHTYWPPHVDDAANASASSHTA